MGRYKRKVSTLDSKCSVLTVIIIIIYYYFLRRFSDCKGQQIPRYKMFYCEEKMLEIC